MSSTKVWTLLLKWSRTLVHHLLESWTKALKILEIYTIRPKYINYFQTVPHNNHQFIKVKSWGKYEPLVYSCIENRLCMMRWIGVIPRWCCFRLVRLNASVPIKNSSEFKIGFLESPCPNTRICNNLMLRKFSYLMWFAVQMNMCKNNVLRCLYNN